MQITIGGVVIQDNGNHDQDQQNANVIKFDSGRPGFPAATDFALPQNSSVRRIRGKLEIGFAGTVVQFLPPGAVSLVLTDLHLSRFALGIPGQALIIEFEHQFAGPVPPVMAGDMILGRFTNVLNQSVNGTTLEWSAFVNGQRIQPPNAPLNIRNGPNTPRLVPINNAGGPMVINAGGPPWTLKGELKVHLPSRNHIVELPNSAEIGIGALEAPREQEQEEQIEA
jgi:hypothetical protein